MRLALWKKKEKKKQTKQSIKIMVREKGKKKRICYEYIKPSLVEPSLVSYSIGKLMLGMGS